MAVTPAEAAANSNAAAAAARTVAAQPQQAAAPPQLTPQQIRERTQQQLMRTPIPCKVTFNEETKFVHIPYGTSYHALQREIRSKWAELSHFKILYWDPTDKEHVTVTCQRDVIKAQQAIMLYMEQVMTRTRTADAPMPNCRFSVVKCKRADVPPSPADEVRSPATISLAGFPALKSFHGAACYVEQHVAPCNIALSKCVCMQHHAISR